MTGIQQTGYVSRVYRKENGKLGYVSRDQYEQLKAQQQQEVFQYQQLQQQQVQLRQQLELQQQAQEQQQVQAQNSECTDGKDDGSIGLFSAIGHAIKGCVKSVVNGVKSMFTDSEGNFSLGKSILSIGLVAASIACPAIGVGLCAVGLAKGVAEAGKGAIVAMNATTDAEAKAAWENIGGGVTTAVISRYGMKASYGAMKSTSTAGANGGSALSELGENATFGAKTKALWKDAKSSTVNGYRNVKTKIGEGIENSAAVEKHGGELHIDQIPDNATRAQILKAYAKDSYAATKHQLKTVANKVKDSKVADKVKNSKVADAVKHPKTTVKNAAKSVKEKASNAIKHPKTTIKNTAKNVKDSKFGNVVRHPFRTAKKGWEKLKNVPYGKIKNSLSAKGRNAWKALTEEGYSKALEKYGYNTVLEVLAVAEAENM